MWREERDRKFGLDEERRTAFQTLCPSPILIAAVVFGDN
jgi:hypothetical protein